MKASLLRYCTVYLGFLIVLNACAFGTKNSGSKYGSTLADLDEVVLPAEPVPVPQVDIVEIEATYRAALDVAKDPDVRHRILIRLADLSLAGSEEKQIDATEDKAFFTEAVDMYEELIDLNTSRQLEDGAPTNERLLYQLSKAHALDGNLEQSTDVLETLVENFPESDYAAEADFRRAELAFSEAQYELAEQLYSKVVAAGQQTTFYTNAMYMQGWSQFKRNRYYPAIDSFTEVLDITLIEGEKLEELSASQRNLSADTLRILSIVFSYLDGAQSISESYAGASQRHYLHLIYQHLGELYLEQERYRDSADSYLLYVKNHPNSDYSPSFSVKAIEVYQVGSFPSFILPAKEDYVRNYGVYSPYWTQRDDKQRQLIVPTLKTYLTELSSFYHSEGQTLKKSMAQYVAKSAKGRNKKATKPEAALPKYLRAAQLYGEYVETFPKDKKNAEIIYLQGEAYFEANYLEEAVSSYERVAYDLIDPAFGAKAGYSAIVALSTLTEQTDVSAGEPNRPESQQSEQHVRWQKHKINSSITFADYYPDDERAVPVLTKAAQDLFQNNQLEQSAKTALRLTQWQPTQEASLLKTAWLILSHSLFDLQKYVEAEASYRQLLSRLDAKDSDRTQVIERIAASMYKQSEAMMAKEETMPAIEKLLSIRGIAPNSDIAITAQYDAANYLLELSQWDRAEQVLLDFQASYPKHRLVATLPAKFALIYQSSEQWDKAAATLTQLYNSESDPETKRQTMYLAAELYEKSKNNDKAIESYKLYANTYPEPFDIATEARFRLVELYGQANAQDKRDFWLKKLMTAHDQAASQGTDRSRYLAAFASAKFADDEFQRFSQIQLTLPLKTSLKKKRKSLDSVLASYKKVINYGVAEFATQSNHRIGMIYVQLSRDLMNSQRPKGLDELALEEYELLLEEQAYPFEEKSIDIHTSNAQRAWEGIYDKWVKQSFSALAELLPARYGKKEHLPEVSHGLN